MIANLARNYDTVLKQCQTPVLSFNVKFHLYANPNHIGLNVNSSGLYAFTQGNEQRL